MGGQVYTSVDGKTYKSVDGIITAARVKAHNAVNWIRTRPPLQRGIAIGIAIGIVLTLIVSPRHFLPTESFISLRTSIAMLFPLIPLENEAPVDEGAAASMPWAQMFIAAVHSESLLHIYSPTFL